MLKNITIGQFFPGTSLVHRIDPRVKILLTLSLIIGVFFVKGLIGYAILFAFVFICTKLSGINPKVIIKSLKPLLYIIVLTFVINAFFTTGEHVIFSVWFLTLSLEGLMAAVYMALRLIFLVVGTQLLTLTTSPIALTDAIERLLKPFSKMGFPAHELAMMMTIALRFIPTLLEETDKIMKAQMARGADFESGNLLTRAKAMIPLLVPLFISAFRRADELAMAMEARCYRGGQNRTRMKILKLTSLDAYAVLAEVTVFVLVALEGLLYA